MEIDYEQITIKKIIEKVNKRKMFLPAIQRKFVWDEDDIIKFMDSILRSYPIGIFLFWDVTTRSIKKNKYLFYDFIKNYHERDLYINEKVLSSFSSGNIWGVLDGQQRLTSLYIALEGSFAAKIPHKRISNNDAYPQKELYFNLLSKEHAEEDIKYEFEFKPIGDIVIYENEKIWLKVKEILSVKDTNGIVRFANKHKLPIASDEIVYSNLITLWIQIVDKPIINYTLIESDSLDEVLDIFVRVNSGGVVLSKIDLLFSTIVSHWAEARDELDDFIKGINKIGSHFRFTNDFVMRSCLYLSDLSVNLTVESFTQENVDEIKNNWESIKKAIFTTVNLLNDFGFNEDNIISYNVFMPIIYYFFKGGKSSKEEKKEMQKYIIIAQVKQLFGGASNSLLSEMRNLLREQKNNEYILRNKSFNLSIFNDLNITGGRDFKIDKYEIESWFDKEKSAYTFMILSLLYPDLKYGSTEFHQDHMHPKALFQKNNLKKLNIPQEKQDEWAKNCNKLANLQLLPGKENAQKSKVPLKEWLKENKNNAKFLPDNNNYELEEFDEFMEDRKTLMVNKLEEILGCNHENE